MHKLSILTVLLTLCFLIFGCSDDTTPEPTPAPTLNPAQVTAIADQISASVKQTLRDELAKTQPSLSMDEITAVVQAVLNKSGPQRIADEDIQAIVEGVISAISVEDEVRGDLAREQPAKGRLETILERGRLICAVNSEFPGFGYLDDQGNAMGFDVDLCRAVAAAVFGDANAVEFRPTAAAERGPTMQSGEVDMMSRNTMWTTSRDATWGNFAHTMFYDGQGFIVPRNLGISSIYDLNGATICVLRGTLVELNLQDFSIQNNMDLTIMPLGDYLSAYEAYLQGQCQSLTTEQSGLVAIASRFPNPDDHVILPETISDEPLGPLVPHGDDQWFDVVKSVMAMLIYAEAYGIHSGNVPTTITGIPAIDRLFGLGGSYNQEALGLKATAAQHVIRQVGNYGQIYDRHLAPLGLVREGSRNALWIGAPCEDCPKGGQIYAAPLR